MYLSLILSFYFELPSCILAQADSWKVWKLVSMFKIGTAQILPSTLDKNDFFWSGYQRSNFKRNQILEC